MVVTEVEAMSDRWPVAFTGGPRHSAGAVPARGLRPAGDPERAPTSTVFG